MKSFLVVRYTFFLFMAMTLAPASQCHGAESQDVLRLRAEQNQLWDLVNKYKASSESLRVALAELNSEMQSRLDSLRDSLRIMRSEFQSRYGELDTALVRQRQGTERALSDVHSRLLSTRWLIAALGLLVPLCAAVILLLITRRLNKLRLDEKAISLDTKFSEILERQLALAGTSGASAEPDHSLAIRVGEEIFRMRKRTAAMDPETKGLGALTNALTRLEDEFNRRGYTITDLTGNEFTHELTVRVANVVERQDLLPDQQTVSRMITPQVMFNGVLVQPGEIELAVSTNRKSTQEPR